MWKSRFVKNINNYDLLHVMFPTGSIKTLRLAKIKNLPVVCHWNGSDVLKLNDPIRRVEFEKSYPHNALHIIVVADPMNLTPVLFGLL